MALLTTATNSAVSPDFTDLGHATGELSPPVGVYGIWFKADVASVCVWALYESSGTANYYRLFVNASNSLALEWSESLTPASDATTGFTITLGKWYFALVRLEGSGSANFLDIYDPSTSLVTQQSGPLQGSFGLGYTTFSLCYHSAITNPAGMNVAEFFSADFDPVTGGAFLPVSTVRQLAMRGPFSVPKFRNRVVMYKSFANNVLVNGEKSLADYYRRGGIRVNWTPLGSTQLVAHPPFLAPDYVSLNDSTRTSVV